jgi:hypothetical protein
MTQPFPTAIPTFADVNCADAFALNLTAYNPGWDTPFPGSVWIGPLQNSNEYTANPGFYKFKTTFTLPAGATAPAINVSTLADNLVAVYLNGTLLGDQAIQDCVTGAPNCNWNTGHQLLTTTAANVFNTGATPNTLEFYLVDTPIGLGKSVGSQGQPTTPPIYNCAQDGPQEFGRSGFAPNPFTVSTPQYAQYHTTHTWDPNVCLNPTGLDYLAVVGYNDAPPPPPDNFQGCTPGYYKKRDFADKTKTFAQLGFTGTGTQMNVTLGNALNFGGGNTVQDAKNMLAREAAAAYANISRFNGTGVPYPITLAQLKTMVSAAFASNDRNAILAVHTTIGGYNSIEGPNC